jgi:hypothetical protein
MGGERKGHGNGVNMGDEVSTQNVILTWSSLRPPKDGTSPFDRDSNDIRQMTRTTKHSGQIRRAYLLERGLYSRKGIRRRFGSRGVHRDLSSVEAEGDGPVGLLYWYQPTHQPLSQRGEIAQGGPPRRLTLSSSASCLSPSVRNDPLAALLSIRRSLERAPRREQRKRQRRWTKMTKRGR